MSRARSVSNPSRGRVGLAALDRLELNEKSRKLLDEAARGCGGSAAWRARKAAEARSLVRLSQLAPPGRLTVTGCDLRATLRMLIALEVPVPCRDEDGGFMVRHGALLGLAYAEEALRQPSPGYAFISIISPLGVWHANVAQNVAGQPLCLGTSLPAGIPCVELIVASYGALAMQNVMVDEQDAAGVLNIEAARWWQQNTHLIPLTKTPLLSPAAETGEGQS